jgi:hypothetical protein
MGELIKFPGPKKEKVEKLNTSEKKEGDNSYLNVKKLTEVLQILTALKKADIGSFNLRTINRKREFVSEYTNEELFGWINNHTEDDIKKRPSFFGAIIDELRSRDLY